MFRTFHSMIFWVIISMVFMMVMSILMVVTTYQAHTQQSSAEIHREHLKKIDSVSVQDSSKQAEVNSENNSYLQSSGHRNLLLFFLIAFLIIISAMFYIIWNISSPINKLLKLVKNVETGKFYSKFEFPTKSELSTLGYAFNDMLKTIEKDRVIIQKNQAELEDKVKQRTVELEKAKIDAETASLAKSDFLAKMSHEIRTPMNGIMGTTEVLANSGMNQQQKDLLNIIHNSSSSLLHIINDILDFSKIESGKLELHNYHFSLRKLIDTTVTQFRLDLANKNLEFSLEIDPKLPDLYIGDKNKIKQILINIIINAIKFTQAGKITLQIKPDDASYPMQKVHFAVADTGVGIPQNKLETIFESFTQVDNTATREYGGTGLGTTISQKLVELMDGKIWAESPNPDTRSEIGGPGSVFHFIISLEQTDDYFFELSNETKVSLKDMMLIVLTQSKELLIELSDIFSYNWIKPIHCNSIKEVSEIVEPVLIEEKDIVILTDYYIYRQEHMDDILTLIRNSNLSFIAMIPNVISSNDSTLQSYGIRHILTLPFRQSEFLDRITEILNERYTDKGRKQFSAITKQIKKKPLRMLLVEDNPINQKVALSIFETIGFSIEVANNGEEAIQKISESTYDLIFMDIQMPTLNGLDATKQLREQGITTPIIAMTANAVSGDREDFLAQGMSDYISKPITYNSITDMIKKWIFMDLGVKPKKQIIKNKIETGDETMQYPILNEHEAINRVYDKDLLKELLVDFTNMKELDWQIFDRHILANNLPDIERLSHSIKGVSGNLALTGIYNTSTALNDSIKLGEAALIKRYYEELKLEVDRFLAFLPEYLKS
jgi:signal transduction histidine kinase/CheY-like chemotaxis protein/HPt (histidine-containing phosphotransfer) domain-containing protein